jgi:hypothetical protein
VHKRGILSREAAAREANELASWDELLARVDESKLPKWAGADRLKKGLLESLRTPKARGRHSKVQQEQEQMFKDFVIFELVNEWRDEQWRSSKTGKVKPFSWREAYARTEKDLESAHMHLSSEAVRAAYRRGAKRYSEGFYASELFLRTVKLRLTLEPMADEFNHAGADDVAPSWWADAVEAISRALEPKPKPSRDPSKNV